MDNLNRNRLIGGGVLLLAGLLFMPAILTPTQQPLTNPDLPTSTPTAPLVTTVKKEIKQKNTLEQPTEEITLVTTDNKQTSENNNATEKELVTVKLESFDAQKTTKPIETVKAHKQESWVRVASFSNVENANELVAKLKSKKYPVSIENIKVKGKPYHRVLLGPYASEKEMRKVLDQIQKEGFSPDVQ